MATNCTALARIGPAITEDGHISGTLGVLVHASWILTDGALESPRAFWSDNRLDAAGTRDLIVVVCHPHSSPLTVTLSAVDDPAVVADAIGQCFDTVLLHRTGDWSAIDDEEWLSAGDLDWRVHLGGSALALASEISPSPFFGA